MAFPSAQRFGRMKVQCTFTVRAETAYGDKIVMVVDPFRRGGGTVWDLRTTGETYPVWQRSLDLTLSQKNVLYTYAYQSEDGSLHWERNEVRSVELNGSLLQPFDDGEISFTKNNGKKLSQAQSNELIVLAQKLRDELSSELSAQIMDEMKTLRSDAKQESSSWFSMFSSDSVKQKEYEHFTTTTTEELQSLRKKMNSLQEMNGSIGRFERELCALRREVEDVRELAVPCDVQQETASCTVNSLQAILDFDMISKKVEQLQVFQDRWDLDQLSTRIKEVQDTQREWNVKLITKQIQQIQDSLHRWDLKKIVQQVEHVRATQERSDFDTLTEQIHQIRLTQARCDLDTISRQVNEIRILAERSDIEVRALRRDVSDLRELATPPVVEKVSAAEQPSCDSENVVYNIEAATPNKSSQISGHADISSDHLTSKNEATEIQPTVSDPVVTKAPSAVSDSFVTQLASSSERTIPLFEHKTVAANTVRPSSIPRTRVADRPSSSSRVGNAPHPDILQQEPVFKVPEHPTDEVSRRITFGVEQEILRSRQRNDSAEQKSWLLKSLLLKVHPDQGGTDQAAIWFNEWKEVNRKWFMSAGR